jgi:predicted nucleic acid-binding protein
MVDYVVITDTSCLILLDKIGALDLLKQIYTNILTTPEIASEFKKPLPRWLQIVAVKNVYLAAIYNEQVDLGEATAIALAQETENALLIVDDAKGRRLATQLRLKFTGTIGLLITARQQNVISSLAPYFEAVKSTNFRIDHLLLDRILGDFKD